MGANYMFQGLYTYSPDVSFICPASDWPYIIINSQVMAKQTTIDNMIDSPESHYQHYFMMWMCPHKIYRHNISRSF